MSRLIHKSLVVCLEIIVVLLTLFFFFFLLGKQGPDLLSCTAVPGLVALDVLSLFVKV